MTTELPVLKSVAQWLANANSTVVMTGAGISTESGIPDYRSPGGIWSKYRTVYYDQFLASADARYEYWQQKVEGHREFSGAKPNVGHQMLAKWEQADQLRGVITQNIDGLHQIAGSRHVLELHGTARQAMCLDCYTRLDIEPLVEQFLAEDAVPPCPSCRGRLKHATISFGQSLPTDVLAEATLWSTEADLMIAIGSSLVVSPAAEIPRIAKQSGARLVIINREETPLDSIADAVLPMPIGAALSSIDALK